MIFDKVRRLDMFAHPVYLTFQGEDKFKTHIGAFLTLICGMVIIAYSVFKFIPVIDDRDATLTKNTLLIND